MAETLPPAKELRALTEADLHGQLEKLRQELWSQRLKTTEGAQQQTHRLGQLRRQIARIQTILKEQRSMAAQR
jgi:large subunit ribosomal protein L29